MQYLNWRMSTHSLAEAVAMATTAPAHALGLTTVGSLAEGNLADVIVVGLHDQLPVVTNTIVGGIQVYDLNYRTKRLSSQALEQSYQSD